MGGHRSNITVQDQCRRRNLVATANTAFVAAALVAIIVTPTFPANAETVVDDGDFSNWVVEFSFGDGASTRYTTGGNPDAYLSLTASSSLSSVVVKENTIIYDPTTEGPIGTISVQADVIGVSVEDDTLQPAFGFCVFQGGEYYIAFVDFDFSSWNTVSALQLTSSDFTNLVNPSLKPDFSASGGSMAFGAIAGASMSGGMDFSLDNYQLSVSPVSSAPSLSAWGMTISFTLMLGSTLWVMRRGRSARST